VGENFHAIALGLTVGVVADFFVHSHPVFCFFTSSSSGLFHLVFFISHNQVAMPFLGFTAPLNFSPLVLFVLFGTVHGVLLAVVIATWRRGNRRANMILTVLLWLSNLALFNAFIIQSGLYQTITFSIRWYDALRSLTGPVLYFYVRAMTMTEPHLVSRSRFQTVLHLAPHLAPTLVYVLWLVPFFLAPSAEKIRFVEQTLAGSSPEYTLLVALRPWYTLAYVLAALHLLRRHARRIRERFSALEEVSLGWLWIVVVGIGVMSVGLGLAGIGALLGKWQPGQINNAMAVVAVVWIYVLVYIALRSSVVLTPQVQHLLAVPLPTDGVPEHDQVRNHERMNEHKRANENKRENESENEHENEHEHNHSDEQDEQDEEREVSALLAQLDDAMHRRRLFADSTLTLQKLADALSVPAYRLSKVLNERVGQSFFDVVNRYRIAEAQQQIIADSNRLYTIAAIAESVGFNAKSAFNAAFKKYTGVTPSEFRASQQQTSTKTRTERR
jgi:AraC-like DNA-binding protein